MEFLRSSLHTAVSAEVQASAQVGLKLHNALGVAVKVVTPLLLITALGLIVWALFGYLYGKSAGDGQDRQKMSKKQFIGIVVGGIILIIFGSVFAGVVNTALLADGKGFSDWFNNHNQTKTLEMLGKLANGVDA